MNKGIIWVVVVLIVLVGGYFFIIGNSADDALDGEEGEKDAMVEDASSMSFFVTSENPGTGANFGGLAGADAHCQVLASAAGVGDKTWRAYLSATATENQAAVNARDRIGSGPWNNANGVLIAGSVAGLHASNTISKGTALDENGKTVNGRGDTPNVHDILTGSNPDGTVAVADGDTTCSNWTSESADGSAIVGHHDRVGLDESDAAKSWNSSHGSRGCSLPDLNGTGGGGLLYCFATGA